MTRKIARLAQLGVVADHSRVKLKIEGKLATDKAYSSTSCQEAFETVIGDEDLLRGLDTRLIGMKVGTTQEIQIPGKEAYGPMVAELLVEVPTSSLPAGTKEGDGVSNPNGGSPAMVLDVRDGVGTLAFGHPWAGSNLVMKVSLLECQEVPENERIRILTTWPGDGKTRPKCLDEVAIHYEVKKQCTQVMLRNDVGTNIDCSRSKGEPTVFVVGSGEIDPGWEKGITKLSLGQSATLHIPSLLTSGMVSDNEVLMEVEVLSINGETLNEKDRDFTGFCKTSNKCFAKQSFGSLGGENFVARR